MYYNDKTQVFLNDKWLKANEATTNLFGQSLHYGNGVFEGIRAYETPDGTRVFKAEEHYERLHFSAKKMHLELNYTVDQLVSLTYELLEKNNLQNAYIRPLVFADPMMKLSAGAKANLFLCAWEWDKLLGSELLHLTTSSYQRPNPKSVHVEAKVTGHYVNSLLATTEATNNGFDEALLLDAKGWVAEGPGANFFYENDGVLYTPPLGNILNGITRKTVMDLAKELGFEVVEKHFTPQDVYGADGAFFTGTAAEVAGIGSLDEHDFKLAWEDTMGYELSKMYQRRVCHNEYQEFALV